VNTIVRSRQKNEMPGERIVRPKRVHLMTVFSALLLNAHGALCGEEAIFMRTTADGTVELSNVPVEKSFKMYVTASETRGEALATNWAEPNRKTGDARGTPLLSRVAQYRELVAQVARVTNVEARLLHAVIAVESGYDSQAVSTRGATGLMQLMPNTAVRYGVTNVLDPQQNIMGGASYLRDLLEMFNSDINLALAAYNAGQNAVLRHGNRIPPYRETMAYVPKVLAIYRKLEHMVI
jgi:soluble lytic murein transglycosylase-like protein